MKLDIKLRYRNRKSVEQLRIRHNRWRELASLVKIEQRSNVECGDLERKMRVQKVRWSTRTAMLQNYRPNFSRTFENNDGEKQIIVIDSFLHIVHEAFYRLRILTIFHPKGPRASALLASIIVNHIVYISLN